MEQVIIRFDLPMIDGTGLLDCICMVGYRETGNKFSVAFHGSKGYLSNIEISCEGNQKANNRLFIENLRNKDRSFKKRVLVNVFHSEEFGVRVSTGDDKPRTDSENFELLRVKEIIVGNQDPLDDLPF